MARHNRIVNVYIDEELETILRDDPGLLTLQWTEGQNSNDVPNGFSATDREYEIPIDEIASPNYRNEEPNPWFGREQVSPRTTMPLRNFACKPTYTDRPYRMHETRRQDAGTAEARNYPADNSDLVEIARQFGLDANDLDLSSEPDAVSLTSDTTSELARRFLVTPEQRRMRILEERRLRRRYSLTGRFVIMRCRLRSVGMFIRISREAAVQRQMQTILSTILPQDQIHEILDSFRGKRNLDTMAIG